MMLLTCCANDVRRRAIKTATVILTTTIAKRCYDYKYDNAEGKKFTNQVKKNKRMMRSRNDTQKKTVIGKEQDEKTKHNKNKISMII